MLPYFLIFYFKRSSHSPCWPQTLSSQGWHKNCDTPASTSKCWNYMLRMEFSFCKPNTYNGAAFPGLQPHLLLVFEARWAGRAAHTAFPSSSSAHSHCIPLYRLKQTRQKAGVRPPSDVHFKAHAWFRSHPYFLSLMCFLILLLCWCACYHSLLSILSGCVHSKHSTPLG